MASARIALLGSGALLFGLALVIPPWPSRDHSPAPVVAAAEGGATAAAAGVTVPNLPLLDHSGRSIGMHDFAGKVVVLTFLYTRCPLPEFCPLILGNLERVRRRANDTGIGGRIAFLGVTLDPSFDSPDVLRRYGAAMLKGRDPFDQWTLATGSPRQIADLARFVGLDYRPEDGIVTHTLMTTVIGRDGRIVRMFPSNAWRPEELFDVAQQVVRNGTIY
jgi:protein SCO1